VAADKEQLMWDLHRKGKLEKMKSHHTLILFRKYTSCSPTAVPLRPAVPRRPRGRILVDEATLPRLEYTCYGLIRYPARVEVGVVGGGLDQI